MHDTDKIGDYTTGLITRSKGNVFSTNSPRVQALIVNMHSQAVNCRGRKLYGNPYKYTPTIAGLFPPIIVNAYFNYMRVFARQVLIYSSLRLHEGLVFHTT